MQVDASWSAEYIDADSWVRDYVRAVLRLEGVRLPARPRHEASQP